MTQHNTFTTARPRLAQELISKGYEPSTGVSPWDSSKTLWIFQESYGLALVVRAFYQNIGKPVPKSLMSYFEGEGGN